MGAKQSYPVPTDEDFRQAAAAAASAAVTPSPWLVCKASSTPQDNSSSNDKDICFTLPCTAWNKKHGQVTDISALGVKLVVVQEQDDEQLLVVQQSHDDSDTMILAVLRQPADYARPLQVCTLQATTSNKTCKPVLTYQGQAWYEYATIDKLRTDGNQHVLRVTQSTFKDTTTTTTTTTTPLLLLWRTTKCGKFQDKVICTVTNVNDDKDKKNNAKLKAYMQELPNQQWAVRVVAGVDPLLVLAMVVAADRQAAVRDKDFLRDASYVAIHNTGGRGLFQKIS